MTVDDLIYYCVEPSLLNIKIYDSELGDIVYDGPGDEVPDEFLYAEIGSYDLPERDSFTININ